MTRCQRQPIKKRHMINRHGSKMGKEICKCGGNYGPPFDQCRDTLLGHLIKKRHMINCHDEHLEIEERGVSLDVKSAGAAAMNVPIGSPELSSTLILL